MQNLLNKRCTELSKTDKKGNFQIFVKKGNKFISNQQIECNRTIGRVFAPSGHKIHLKSTPSITEYQLSSREPHGLEGIHSLWEIFSHGKSVTKLIILMFKSLKGTSRFLCFRPLFLVFVQGLAYGVAGSFSTPVVVFRRYDFWMLFCLARMLPKSVSGDFGYLTRSQNDQFSKPVLQRLRFELTGTLLRKPGSR